MFSTGQYLSVSERISSILQQNIDAGIVPKIGNETTISVSHEEYKYIPNYVQGWIFVGSESIDDAEIAVTYEFIGMG